MGIKRRAPGAVKNHIEATITLAGVNTALFFTHQFNLHAHLAQVGLNHFRHGFTQGVGADKRQFKVQRLARFFADLLARRQRPARAFQQ